MGPRKRGTVKDNGHEFDTRFRALTVATLGSGAVVLALLQFAGGAWGSLPPAARASLAEAVRTSFFAFLLLATLAVVAYALASRLGGRIAVMLNAGAAVLFFVGAVLSSGLTSDALKHAGAMADPSEGVRLFFGLGTVGWLAALIALGLAALRGKR